MWVRFPLSAPILESRMKKKVKQMNDWLKSKFGPNVWVTENHGLGWAGDNPEFEEFTYDIFGMKKEYYEKKIAKLMEKFFSEQVDAPPEFEKVFQENFKDLLA